MGPHHEIPTLEQVLGPVESAGLPVAVFDDIEPDPGLETIMRGVEVCTSARCGVILALGGGSPIDMAKDIGVVVENGRHICDYAGSGRVPRPAAMPLICLPTTAGTGSELTAFAVLSNWEEEIVDIRDKHGPEYVAVVLNEPKGMEFAFWERFATAFGTSNVVTPGCYCGVQTGSAYGFTFGTRYPSS